MSIDAKSSWQVVGEEVGACNCAWGCPCQFNALPTHGRCEALAGWHITKGYFGSTRLDGVKYVRIFWWPGPLHEGNGTRQLVIDEQTTQEQRDAVIALESGTQGGAAFEVFAAIAPNTLKTLIAPISFESDRKSGKAHLRVSKIGELHAEPIKNPVTGEEHRAQIVLPNGFEYKEAEVVNSVSLLVQSEGPLAFEHKGTYAQLNAFDWSNA